MPVAVTENTDYIVRVYSNTQYGDPGTFTICVSTGTPPPPAPENDECGSVTAQALNVGSPVTFAGTTIGATVTGDYAPGSALDGSGPSVWHAFTITECASVTVAYCGTTPAFGNVWIVLADACPANDLFFFQTWDTTQCGDQNITIFYDSLAAGTYYLPVLVDGTANGPYTILLTATATPEACVVGFDEVAIDARDWSIYPNPGSGVFNLNYNGPSGDVAVELFDATGRRVYNEQRHLNSGTIRSVDLSTLAPGGYNVRLTANGVRTEQRLMVK